MYTFITLENGVRVGLFKMDSVKSVAVKAMLTAGPLIENETNNGASHYLEHIVLSGTKSYPTKLEFAEILEELGVSYSGYTSTQEMGFEFDVPYTNTYKTLDILKEILFEPVFTDEIIEKERNVILEEMQDRSNSPDFQFFYKCQGVRYKGNHPLIRKVIGTKEVIQSIQKDALTELYKKIFNPSNLFLCLVGNFDDKQVIDYLQNTFGRVKNTFTLERPKYSNNDLSGYSVYSEADEKFSNVFSNISFPGFSREMSAKTEMTMKIFSSMFAGLRTSRLFQDVREKEGLVYSIYSDWSTSWGTGTFSIAFESDYSKIQRILEIVFKDIENIKKNGFSDKELEHMKNYLTNRTLLSFSSPWKINQWILDYLFDNQEVLFPEDLIEIGQKITHDDINTIVNKIFDYSGMNIVMMGKLENFNLEESVKGLRLPVLAPIKTQAAKL